MAVDSKRKRYRKLLEQFLYSPTPNDDGEWKAWCPLHDDDTPSASINFDKGVWNCFSGCGGGTLSELVERIEADQEATQVTPNSNGVASSNVFEDADEVIQFQESRNRKNGNSESVTDAQVIAWHEALLNHPKMLKRFKRKRGLSLDTLKQYEVGWDRKLEVFTIPIRDTKDHLLNVRRYKMDAPSDEIKMTNVRGMGSARLFPETELEHEDTILICEGELDALLAIQEGFPAVTGTGGAKTWKPDWSSKFEGKTVYIVYDRDESGDAGARKAAHSLISVAKAIHVVKLPVEGKGADLTDFFVRDENTSRDLRQALEATPEWTWQRRSKSSDNVIDVDVIDSMDAKHSRKSLRMTATITGRRNPPYLVPKKIHYECTMDAGSKCAICPMLSKNGSADAYVDNNDPTILQMIDVGETRLQELMRGVIGAQKCNRLLFDIQEERAVEELFLRPSIEDITEETEGDYTNRRVYNVDRHDTLPNQTVRIVGSPLPNPGTQRNEFLAWNLEHTDSSIDTFDIDDDAVEMMEMFQPAAGQRPLKKVGEIARDLSTNVTHIYGRDDMHVAMDLVFHSVLHFQFAGKPIDKGWLELLVLGDTRTGKSEAASRLTKHYRAGKLVSCESASFAGIVGGLQQYGAGKEWVIQWGVIPLNDRRAVILDEVAGLTQDQIAQMSSIRSSGVAQLTKIQTEATSARTRLIWLANPRKGRMADYTYGVHAIRPLIGNQEDIARFDLALTVSTADVAAKAINRSDHKQIEHEYTAEACHTLLMWAWSRKSDQVVWEKNAEETVYKAAVWMGERYVEDPPLVQAANVRMKIARLAVALAARTFSTDEDYENVIVKKVHVQDAVLFIDYLYNRPGFGYRESSKEAIEDYKEAVRSQGEMKKYLLSRPGLAKFLRSMQGHFRRIDMEDMMNIAKEEANSIINRLWKARMVSKQEGSIRINPLLHELLREIKE